MGTRMEQVLGAGLWLSGLVATLAPALVRGADQAYTELRGRWQAIELVDDGRVIPPEAFHTWMPSGGQVEVIDNTIVFTSSADGQRHARTFEVDATRYPSEFTLRVDGRLSAHGIYKLDEGRWVICGAPAPGVARPTDFSAPAGSRRVLLVLKRPADTPQPSTAPAPVTDLAKLPAPPDLRAPAGTTGKLLTDAEVVQMLLGTWKYNDAYGDFFLTLDSKGTFNTFRETATSSAFQQVFVRSPVSSGTWGLNNGQLTFRCTASVQRDRVNLQVPLAVRSISANDLIFVDSRGRVVKGVKVR